MPQFIFQLQAVLQNRQHIEYDRQRDVASVQSKLTALELQLMRLDDEVKASNEIMRRDHLTGPIDTGILSAHRRYLAMTQKQAAEIIAAMQKINADLESARIKLSQAALDRKTMEILREKYKNQWKQKQQHSQAAEQDEIAMQMFYRNTVK